VNESCEKLPCLDGAAACFDPNAAGPGYHTLAGCREGDTLLLEYLRRPPLPQYRFLILEWFSKHAWFLMGESSQKPFVSLGVTAWGRDVGYANPLPGCKQLPAGESWSPTHFMVLLGQWRPPRLRQSASRPQQLRDWWNHSYACYLLRKICNEEPTEAQIYKLYQNFRLGSLRLDVLERLAAYAGFKLVDTYFRKVSVQWYFFLTSARRKWLEAASHMHYRTKYRADGSVWRQIESLETAPPPPSWKVLMAEVVGLVSGSVPETLPKQEVDQLWVLATVLRKATKTVFGTKAKSPLVVFRYIMEKRSVIRLWLAYAALCQAQRKSQSAGRLRCLMECHVFRFLQIDRLSDLLDEEFVDTLESNGADKQSVWIARNMVAYNTALRAAERGNVEAEILRNNIEDTPEESVPSHFAELKKHSPELFWENEIKPI